MQALGATVSVVAVTLFLIGVIFQVFQNLGLDKLGLVTYIAPYWITTASISGLSVPFIGGCLLYQIFRVSRPSGASVGWWTVLSTYVTGCYVQLDKNDENDWLSMSKFNCLWLMFGVACRFF